MEKTGRRIVAEQADVSDFEKLKAVVASGVSGLGRIDFVLANAGIMPRRLLPALLERGEGGAIVITSSISGLTGMRSRLSMKKPGAVGYLAAKHSVVGLMRGYANSLAQRNIRVNTRTT